MSISTFTAQQRREAAASVITRRINGERRFLAKTAAEWSVSSKTLTRWIEEYFPEAIAVEQSTPDRRSRFPLRGIIVHEPCGAPMQCCRADGEDLYRCPSPCPRPVSMRTDEVHDCVLESVSRSAAALVRRYSDGEPDIYIVPGLIWRLTVANTPRPSRLAWRPNGFDRRAADRHATPWQPRAAPATTRNRREP